MECLILEHVGEQLFTRPAVRMHPVLRREQTQTTAEDTKGRVFGGWHSQVQQLAPYIDANGDEQVSHDEFTAFVRNFGGVDDSRETLQKAIQVTASSYHLPPTPPFTVCGHCSVVVRYWGCRARPLITLPS
jgi:hypothetical protein